MFTGEFKIKLGFSGIGSIQIFISDFYSHLLNSERKM